MAAENPDVTFRALRLDDTVQLREWRNRPEVARYMYTDHQISESEHAAWFGGAMTATDRQYWIIELDGQPVGLANLYDIRPEHRRAYWAFYLADPNVRGRGVGSATERFVMNHVFNVMACEKLACEVLSSNPAVAEMHAKFGFSVDGTLRRHIWKIDHFEDVIAMSILADEWRARQ